LFWTWKVRGDQPGRPAVPKDVRDLIRKMCRENPLWGAPRIHGELLKLGIDVGETSVGKYIVRKRNPPSQNWRTFIARSGMRWTEQMAEAIVQLQATYLSGDLGRYWQFHIDQDQRGLYPVVWAVVPK
jgi:hypothetical protein